jgi:hypothetical protein
MTDKEKDRLTMGKAIALMAVALMLVGVLTGCAALNSAKEVKQGLDELATLADEIEQAGADEGTVVFQGELHGFENALELLATFSEFAYQWEEISDGHTEEWSFSYESLGREEVNGVDAERYKCIKVENDEAAEYEFWFDDEWLAVKSLVNGELKEGLDSEMEAALLTMLTQLYINRAATDGMVFSEPGVLDFGYSLEGESREDLNLGSGSVKVDLYTIKSEFAGITYTIGLAEIGGKKLYVNLIAGTDESSSGLRVTRAVPR